MDLVEKESKYFKVGTVGKTKPEATKPSRSVMWHDKESLEHAEDMNNVSVQPGKKGYNRDKYEPAKPSHQYSLIGDPVKLGMDVDQAPPKQSSSEKLEPKYERHRNPDWQPKEAYMPKPQPEPDAMGIMVDLPPNIRHQFGTKICKEVLSDKSKLDATLEEQAKSRAAANKSKIASEAEKNILIDLSPSYDDLSRSIRQNVFPGYPARTKLTTKQDAYTWDVFERSVPMTDEFKVYRDEYSKSNIFS